MGMKQCVGTVASPPLAISNRQPGKGHDSKYLQETPISIFGP